MSILNEKLIVGYVAVGPTYRKSLYDKLINTYFDDENLYYCVITDNTEYFKDIKRKNLIVNEPSDFFNDDIKKIEKEYLIKTEDKEEYAEEFRKGYRFPFSVYRFILLQAIKLEITNVTFLCTDTKINFNILNNEFLIEKNVIYNAISNWYSNKNENNIDKVYPYIENKYNTKIDENVLVLDAAARFYIAENVNILQEFFDIWDDVVSYLYDSDNIKHFRGGYVINDEYILTSIYNKLNMKHKHNHALFDVKHNSKVERFWT